MFSNVEIYRFTRVSKQWRWKVFDCIENRKKSILKINCGNTFYIDYFAKVKYGSYKNDDRKSCTTYEINFCEDMKDKFIEFYPNILIAFKTKVIVQSDPHQRDSARLRICSSMGIGLKCLSR